MYESFLKADPYSEVRIKENNANRYISLSLNGCDTAEKVWSTGNNLFQVLVYHLHHKHDKMLPEEASSSQVW